MPLTKYGNKCGQESLSLLSLAPLTKKNKHVAAEARPRCKGFFRMIHRILRNSAATPCPMHAYRREHHLLQTLQ
jgi:hypothetical protein